MIDLRGRFPDRPTAFENPLPPDANRSVRAQNRSLARARQKIADIISSDEYPQSEDFKPVWKKFKPRLVKAQHGGKCAFCETRIFSSSPGDVEHYRPKAAIEEPQTSGNRDDTGGRPPARDHHPETKPGYWWLAYEWTNYLFACKKCNTWKGNSFPLRDPRGEMKEGIEARERPLLLNPYLTDPTSHFTFDERGQIASQTMEGSITIDRCGLDRESLRLERERIVKKMLDHVEDMKQGLCTEDYALELLLGFCREEEPFAATARSFFARTFQLAGSDIPLLLR